MDQTSKKNNRGLTWLSSIPYVFGPTLLMIVLLYLGIPLLISLGFDNLSSFALCFSLTWVVLLGLALVVYRREGSEQGFSAFFSLNRLSIRSVALILLLGTVGTILITALLGGVSIIFSEIVNPPEYLPIFDPDGISSRDFFGSNITGNYLVLIVTLLIFVLNLVAEELWWRGYVMKRQQIVFQSKTWLVHGLYWGLFHLFNPWNIVVIIPISLLTAFVAQRWDSTYASAIVHGINNLLVIISITSLIIA